jgi:hypothetical protein
MEDQLDLLAGLLLEGRDGLLNRLSFLDVVALIPRHHEVGSLRVGRCCHEPRRQHQNSNAHHGCFLAKSRLDYAPAGRRQQGEGYHRLWRN